jgi:hypothetical protein
MINTYEDVADAFKQADTDLRAALHAKGKYEAAALWDKS